MQVLENTKEVKFIDELLKHKLINKSYKVYNKETYIFSSQDIVLPLAIDNPLKQKRFILGFLHDKQTSNEFDGKIKELFTSYTKNTKALLKNLGVIKEHFNQGIKLTTNMTLRENDEDYSDLISKMTNLEFNNVFNLKLSRYENEEEAIFYVLNLSFNDNINNQWIPELVEAVKYENSMYRIHSDNERNIFTPLTTSPGKLFLGNVNFLNTILEELSQFFLDGLMEKLNLLSSEKDDSVMVEFNDLNGIELRCDTVYYKNNIITPAGKIIISETDEPESLYVLTLNDSDLIEYLPNNMNSSYNLSKFKESTKLHEVAKLFN